MDNNINSCITVNKITTHVAKFWGRGCATINCLQTPKVQHKLALWLLAMALTGCALSDNNGQSATADTPPIAVNDEHASKQQLTQELQAIRESQKKLQRLTELESDLMLLVAELAKQPTIKARPDGYRPQLSTETIQPEAVSAPASEEQTAVIADPSEPAAPPKNAKSLVNTDPSGETAQESTPMEAAAGTATEIAPNTAAENPTRRAYNSSNYLLWLGFFVSEPAANAVSRRLRNAIDFQRMGLAIEVIANANVRGQYYGLVLGPFTLLERANAFCAALSNHGQYCQVRSNTQGSG